MYVSDYQYFLTAINPGEYYRIQEPVWEHRPYGDRGAGDCGYGGEHGGGGDFLQNKGEIV